LNFWRRCFDATVVSLHGVDRWARIALSLPLSFMNL